MDAHRIAYIVQRIPINNATIVQPGIAIIVKGYPRLSETFIAQEIHALQARGLDLYIVSLRRPTEAATHPVHDDIHVPVLYLPEYLYQQPWRVFRGWWQARRLGGYKKSRNAWLADLRKDRTFNRVRRFGQALVLAAELPASNAFIYAHFLHTPGSVARYTSLMNGIPWSCSAHAKDIWTTPEWEKKQKLDECQWLVSCTAANVDHLRSLCSDPAKISLVYHGLDFERFDEAAADSDRSVSGPLCILSVGRAVEKKGYGDLLQALKLLPPDLHWRFVHIGGGALIGSLKATAQRLGIDAHIEWCGAQPHDFVLAAYRRADVFVLPSRIAEDGDRDGLPNVLLEAQSQKLPCISTRISGIPELLEHGVTGLLVEQRDPAALAEAIRQLLTDPALRNQLGLAGFNRVRSKFSVDGGIDRIISKFPKHVVPVEDRVLRAP